MSQMLVIVLQVTSVYQAKRECIEHAYISLHFHFLELQLEVAKESL